MRQAGYKTLYDGNRGGETDAVIMQAHIGVVEGKGYDTGGCTDIVMMDSKTLVYGYGGNIGG